MVCTNVLMGRVHHNGCIPQLVVPKISHVYKENKRMHLFVSRLSHSTQRSIFGTVKSALNSQEKQLRALDSYFKKLHNSTGASSSNEIEELTGKNHQLKAEKSLKSLNDFSGKANGGAESKLHAFSVSDDETFEEASYFSMKMIDSGGRAKKLKQYMKLKAKDIDSSNQESSSFYFIGILASINIAVFLFETASPVRNSEIGMLSLPMVYGAKINHLILLGEWWRLLTPMFLHSGVLHIALGCWVLLSFGPQVCKAYGSFAFFLIYVLGGISGNLISFLHTPDPTVGGTGPGFALIGAWLIYQVRNKDMLGKESMIEKAIMATAFSFVLSNLGPIDDWAHFGAALMGIAYGYLTCPALQLDNAASENGQKEGITLVEQYSDPCKSLIYFSVFILLLASLLLVIEPPLNSIAEAVDRF
ncbi:PREDICTED: RHOMBOID-like protein 9, chloroplastic [Nicotiana attenuata]|uniref:Rhomboid-like protein 9, chloroplastic n=1 Tax=Nicotiana attenuata TaxID=49451 RepID=A0A1J6INX8_NICAT|nr:PREDICTED: RHOMBOID-like protein 9, chloroplastic [Nicotiana attenuata]XP_019229977.1 PREDICTED: RHOMBOID-like protein 9, chloroplastic [Nicotiana attenuata]OIT06402.1 rhomboid-like protein 9, chloroplastic [Nicotiana attenuata]